MDWEGKGVYLFLEVMPHTTRCSARIGRRAKRKHKLNELWTRASFWNRESCFWHGLPWGQEKALWAASAHGLERQKHSWAPQLDGVPVSWRHIILTLSLPVLQTSWMHIYRNAGLVFKTESPVCCVPSIWWAIQLVFLHGSFEERWFCNLNHREISYHSWLVHLWTLLSTWFQDLLICLAGSYVLGGSNVPITIKIWPRSVPM